MNNLEITIADIQNEIAQLRSKLMQLEENLEKQEKLWLMLPGKSLSHRHRCSHCGAYSVCPQAYGEDCPLEATAPADCRDDPYGGE